MNAIESDLNLMTRKEILVREIGTRKSQKIMRDYKGKQIGDKEVSSTKILEK